MDTASEGSGGRVDTGDVGADGGALGASGVELTVVMATKNRPELATRMCLSVLRSTGVDLEVVIVDDGSSPEAAVALERLRSIDQRVRLEQCAESLGPSRARNRGLALARGRWTSFVDDDDLVGPEFFRTLLDRLESVGAEWGFGAAVSIDDQLQITGSRPASCPTPMLRALLRENIVPASGLAVTASTALLTSIGGFDASCVGAEDWDLVIRLAIAGEPVMVEEPMLAFRSVSAGSVSADTDRVLDAARTLRRKFDEHYRRLDVDVDWPALDRYLVMGDLTAGRRRSAALRAVRAASPGGRRRALAKAALIVLSPSLASRHAQRRIRAQVPERVRTYADAWLRAFADDWRDLRATPAPRPPQSA